jgi:hypothetical protein
MWLYFYTDGKFQPYEMPTRSRCSAEAIENDIRKVAHANGNISTISIRIGNECIPITHVDEARIISRIITADSDCYVSHFYEKGFEEEEKQKPPTDTYHEDELWKLEFDYEQHADLGTPCFGAAGTRDEYVF